MSGIRIVFCKSRSRIQHGKGLIALGGNVFHISNRPVPCPLNRVYLAFIIHKGFSLKCAKAYYVVTLVSGGIENHHGIALACNGSPAPLSHIRKLSGKLSVFLPGHLIHFPDGGSGQNVVELVQQHHLPHGIQLGCRIIHGILRQHG